MSKLSAKAADYEYARLYLNNARLKEIEPLVLVDMPGFDSPLDAHNKAIMVYLDRGLHYIVLSSSEEGTISNTLMMHLKTIVEDLDSGFDLFISKTDLLPKEETDELRRHYRQQIKDHFDKDMEVMPLDNKSADNVLKALNLIDADKLFFNIYREDLKRLCTNSVEEIKIKISALSKDEASMSVAVSELDEKIAEMEQEAKKKGPNVDKVNLSDVVDNVVKDIGIELENAREEIIHNAMTSSDPAYSVPALINEIIRSSAISSVKKNMNAMSEKINKDCLLNAQALDKVMKDIEIDVNYSSNIFDEIQNRVGQILNVGLLTNLGIGPLLKTVLPVLFSALNFVFSGLGKIFFPDKQRKAVESWLFGTLIPPLKRRIREEIPEIIAPAIETMKGNVQDLWLKKLESNKEQIGTAIEEKKSGRGNIEKERQALEKICAEVKALGEEVLGV